MFVTGGDNSIAFYMAKSGYDVWLGNNRCTNQQGLKNHTHYTPSSTQYWNWSLDELAKYDFPTLVEFICTKAKVPHLVFIGHSQGNAQGFMSLINSPALQTKIKCFVALAPAVYLGPLLK